MHISYVILLIIGISLFYVNASPFLGNKIIKKF